MNIYIPIGSYKEINFDVLAPLENYNVHLTYEKRINIPQTSFPRLREDFESLKKQKNRILKLGSECGEDYFIMMDSDILHVSDGIERLIHAVKKEPEYSLIGLWPYYNEQLRQEGNHVSSACCIIKTKDVTDYELDYEGGCFCSALIRRFIKEGKLFKVLETDNCIKHLNKQELTWD